MRLLLPSVSDKHSLSEIERKEKSAQKTVCQNDGAEVSHDQEWMWKVLFIFSTKSCF